MLFDHLNKFSKRTALISEKLEKLSYAELISRADKIGRQVSKKSLIFILCENNINSIIAYVGFIRSGNTVCLLDQNINDELLKNIIHLYQPSFIFSNKKKIIETTNDCGIENSFLYKNKKFINYKINKNLALLLSTSGTTGSKKLVRISYKNLYSNSKAIIQYLKLNKSDKAITTLPMHYTYGLSIINTHLCVGAKLVVTRKNIIERDFWNLINIHKVTNFGGVPFTFEILKKIKFQKLNLPSLKHITQAGGKLKKELSIEFEKILSKKRIKFFRMYGSTEATSRMAYMPTNLNEKHPESIGFAIPGGKLWLQDKKKKKITSTNIVGEIVYKGSNVCLGYANSKKDLKRGDENKGILLTGDLGTIDQNKLIFIIGRKKRFLKVFGLRVNLDELETILNNLGYKCLCSGLDNKLKIYFLKKFKKDSSNVIDKISNITKINKSVFKIEFIDKFPRNHSGKILYNKLN